MPRINNLARWLFRRIKRPGDSAYFKIISRTMYKSRTWWYAIVAVVYFTKCADRNVFVLTMYTKKPVEYPFDHDSEVFVKEFQSLVGVINFVEGWFKQDKYVYYYTRIRRLV